MIIDSELQYAYPATISDTSANGGVPSSNLIPTATLQNVFPHAFKAERDAGSTKHRKVFLKVGNADNDALYNSIAWLDGITAADDYVCFFAGSMIDTAADIGGTEDKYGCASLSTDVTGGVTTTIECTVENVAFASGNDIIFRNTGKIRLTNMDDIDDATGTEEILDVSGLSWNGNIASIQVSVAPANSYTVSEGSRVMSVLEIGTIQGTVSDHVVTTAGDGDYDYATNPVVVDSIGGLYGTITVLFDSASTFTVSGDNGIGSLGAGNKTTDFEPQNSAFSRNIFTLLAAGWQDTWASGDTFVFRLNPPQSGIWEKRIIPLAATSLTDNELPLVYTGEAAD